MILLSILVLEDRLNLVIKKKKTVRPSTGLRAEGLGAQGNGILQLTAVKQIEAEMFRSEIYLHIGIKNFTKNV